jgi:hypothetical protein
VRQHVCLTSADILDNNEDAEIVALAVASIPQAATDTYALTLPPFSATVVVADDPASLSSNEDDEGCAPGPHRRDAGAPTPRAVIVAIAAFAFVLALVRSRARI